MHAAMVDEHRDQISDLLGDAVALGDDIENLALLIGGNCGIVPDAAQFGAFGEQGSDGAQFCDGAAGIGVVAEDDVGEGAGVNAGDGSHLAAVLSSAGRSGFAAKFAGKIANETLIGGGIDVNLFFCEANGQVGGENGEFAARVFGGGGDFLLCSFDNFASVLLGGGLDARFFFGGFLLGAIAHHADFAIELHQAIIDIGEAPAGVFAGLLRFLHGLLN